MKDIDTSRQHLAGNEIDLLLLDLNLNGQDGFGILQHLSAESFHTVIISAQKEKAIEAFEYGVVDFVPKPFDLPRLELAINRVKGQLYPEKRELRYLSVKQKGQVKLLKIEDVLYFRGSDIYSEIHLRNGETLLHDKTLEKLSQLLGNSFERIHKSYLVAFPEIDKLIFKNGGSPGVKLMNGKELPVGRTRYMALKKKLI
ncbi:response regulator transcription factor [Pedobacter sp. PAMC26386]|nr:response regulator transcription factor [Pedobacter sp. PAMC26386]